MKINKAAQKGFTLIELLIVIALLGALAVGLLATIDPFEQLKKGRDTSTRNTVSEFYNASIRYYSINSQFPWISTEQTGVSLTEGAIPGYITDIMEAGELKDKFIELAGTTNLGKIYLTSTAETGATAGQVIENIAVCFRPESKAFRQDQNSLYDIYGETSAGCTDVASRSTSTCYWCMK